MKPGIRVEDDDPVRWSLAPDTIDEVIGTSSGMIRTMRDRENLHGRDYLERFFDILLGEIAEQMVLGWLTSEGKSATSAVDKQSGRPDRGHDLLLRGNSDNEVLASVKSSVAVFKSTIPDILDSFTLATTPEEARDVNIQVCFWLEPFGEPRVNVPAIKNAAIMAWAGAKDLEAIGYANYRGEQRAAPEVKLREFRPMRELLKFLS